MSNSKKLLLQDQLRFQDQLFHETHKGGVWLPAGSYVLTMQGSGGQAGQNASTGALSGAGARGQFMKIQFRLSKPTRARWAIGVPGGLNADNVGGAGASPDGAGSAGAGGDGAGSTYFLLENVDQSNGLWVRQYTDSSYTNLSSWYNERIFPIQADYVFSVWGGGGGGGGGMNWTTGKYKATRLGGAGGGFRLGHNSNIYDSAVLSVKPNAAGLTFEAGEPLYRYVAGRNAGSNGAGDTLINAAAYGGSGGTSGIKLGATPQTARTPRIYGSGAAGANGATSVDNNQLLSYYGAGGGGAGGGPNGFGGAGGATSRTEPPDTGYGEAGYNHTTIPSMVVNPITGAETNTDYGAGGTGSGGFGTWGYIKIEALGAE